MTRRHPTSMNPAHGGTGAPGWRSATVLVALSLLLAPSIATAQAPSPEEALNVVVEHLRDRSEVFDDWHLGVDPEWAGRIYAGAVIDAARHHELLRGIAEAGGLPFYPGEDFGRVVCAAPSNPERAPENCRFSHGTRSILRIIVLSTDEEGGVTKVHAISGSLRPVAVWLSGEWLVGAPSRVIMLDVEYGPGGRAQVMVDRTVTALRSGAVSIDEIRGAPPG